MATTNSKLRSLLATTVNHARANLITAVFSVAFGVLGTAIAFYVTSPPTTAAEVHAKIIDLARAQVQHEAREEMKAVKLDYFSSEALDLSVSNSIFVFGTATTATQELFRFVGIFQSSSPSLIDKIIGRQGFIKPTYVALIPAWRDDCVLLDNVDFADIDKDGNKEIVVSLKSNHADSIASGLIILKKDESDNWNLFGIPSLEKGFQDQVASFSHHDNADSADLGVWFERKTAKKQSDSRLRAAFTNFNVDEEPLEILHGGRTLEFQMLGNGGRFKVLSHPESGYPQLAVATPLIDDEGVVENHHLMVRFFRIENQQMTIDRGWNQGRPMLSRDTESPEEIDFDDFEQVGVSANTVDGIFFSPTGFGRSARQ